MNTKKGMAWSLAVIGMVFLGFTEYLVVTGGPTRYPLFISMPAAIFAGGAFGYGLGLAIYYLNRKQIDLAHMPEQRAKARESQLALVSIAILSLLLSWIHWSDVPTNAQIDAIHNDPRFAAAIAEVKAQLGQPDRGLSRLTAVIDRRYIFTFPPGRESCVRP